MALTVIFGPIGLIKHGKNVDIPEGTPFTAYVDQDYSLPRSSFRATRRIRLSFTTEHRGRARRKR